MGCSKRDKKGRGGGKGVRGAEKYGKCWWMSYDRGFSFDGSESRGEGSSVQQREKCETSPGFHDETPVMHRALPSEGTNTTTISSGILKFSKANTHRFVTKMHWPNNKFRIVKLSIIYISFKKPFFLLYFLIITSNS